MSLLARDRGFGPRHTDVQLRVPGTATCAHASQAFQQIFNPFPCFFEDTHPSVPEGYILLVHVESSRVLGLTCDGRRERSAHSAYYYIHVHVGSSSLPVLRSRDADG